ncbi:MAG TPA: ABC transporter permease [Thermoplasmata archaeon]|nr:ABC transporter permease [Thermoplasmata archaeon]
MSGLPFNPLEGLIRLLLASSLLVIVLVLSHLRRIGIGREFAVGLVKGGLQLLLIAVILTAVFVAPLWYVWVLVMLVAMVLVAGWTSSRRAGDMPGPMGVTLPSIATGSGTVLAVLAASGAMPPGPQYVVPLAGMSIGNCMTICTLTLDRLIREARLNRGAVEAALSLGATPDQALEVYHAISVRSALIPTIDRLRTLGIIFIPGAMAGLLLAGTAPIVAAEYQMIVYLMIVGGGIITALLTGHLARGRLFTPAEQVANWVG